MSEEDEMNKLQKRSWRLYKEEGLSMRSKSKKKIPAHLRVPLSTPEAPSASCSADFVSAVHAEGRTLRFFNDVDEHTRENKVLSKVKVWS